MKKKKVIIIAPFWNNPPHVGIYRTERYISWFLEKQFKVYVIRIGNNRTETDTNGLTIISVRNRVSKYQKFFHFFAKKLKLRIIKLLFNKLIYFTLIPDENIIWANSVYKSSLIGGIVEDADYILSTSPPNSSHIAAYKLSRKYNIKHLVDMRDGWLDEPLRPYLKENNLRKRIEEKMEKHVIENAHRIYVTAENWKIKLSKRYFDAANIISVITNAYPELEIKNTENNKHNMKVLIYAGNFFGNTDISRLEAMFEAFYEHNIAGIGNFRLELYGNKGGQDQKVIDKFASKIKSSNLELNFMKPVSRIELLDKMNKADGLLLPSISFSAIPSKTFEYILLKKPVLSITYRNSSTWKIAEELPQFFNFPILEDDRDYQPVKDFISICSSKNYKSEVPEKYSSIFLNKEFFQSLDQK